MRIDLVQIGNSKGIRIPKAIIEQAQLTEVLDMEVAEGVIILRSAHQPREAWEKAAAECRAAGEDQLDAWDVIM